MIKNIRHIIVLLSLVTIPALAVIDSRTGPITGTSCTRTVGNTSVGDKNCDGQAPAAQSGAVTGSLVASRTSGPAPLAVYFDSTGATHTDSSIDTFRQMGYYFDFDDPGSGTWAHSGQSKNTDIGGPLSVHVFESPGTYVVAVRALDSSNNYDDEFVTITVTDPDAVYSGTNTVCITTDPDFSGITLPSGCQQVTSFTSYSQLPAGGFESNKRYLFERGKTYPGTINLYAITDFQIGTIGTGAKPVTGTVMIDHGKVANITVPERFVVADLNPTNIMQEKMANDYLLLRNTVDSAGYNIQYGGSLGYYATNETTGPDLGTSSLDEWFRSDLVFIVENVVDMQLTTGVNGNNGIQGLGSRVAILGNVSNNADEHGMRVFGSYKLLHAHNSINGVSARGAKHATKIHAIGTEPWTNRVNDGTLRRVLSLSRYIRVAYNRIGSASNPDPWIVQIAPQDDGSSNTIEFIYDVIVEGNTFIESGTTQADLMTLANNVSYRGNTGNSGIYTPAYPSNYTTYNAAYDANIHGPVYNESIPDTQAPVRP